MLICFVFCFVFYPYPQDYECRFTISATLFVWIPLLVQRKQFSVKAELNLFMQEQQVVFDKQHTAAFGSGLHARQKSVVPLSVKVAIADVLLLKIPYICLQ